MLSRKVQHGASACHGVARLQSQPLPLIVTPDLQQGQGSALRVPGKQQDAQGLRVTCITPEGQGEAVPAVSHGKGEEGESH